MYGLINKALQDLVCSRFGEATWEQSKPFGPIQIQAREAAP